VGEMNIAGDLSGISRCPHCAIANPQLKQIWVTQHPLFKPSSPLFGRYWAAYQCTTCSDVILVQCELSSRTSVGSAFSNNQKVEAIYPPTKTVDSTLPETARRYLSQALETLHAPDAAAVMAASAVDAMLKDKGLIEGSLYTRIDAAVKAHTLTEGMGRWAHAVRLEANNVRHADGENPHVTETQARQVVEFATALGDFLYALTSKIDAGVRSASTPAKILP